MFLDYALGNLGEDACPDGYDTISDTSTCELASIYLGLDYLSSENTNKIINDNEVICNWRGSKTPQITRVSGNHGTDAKWICQLSLGKNNRWILSQCHIYCMNHIMYIS